VVTVLLVLFVESIGLTVVGLVSLLTVEIVLVCSGDDLVAKVEVTIDD